MIIVFRHGESTANISKTIASDLKGLGRTAGLTEVGRVQAKQSARNLLHALPELENGYGILSSPFKRTVETTLFIRSVLGIPKLSKEDARLGERFFGKFEGQSTDNYEKVWERDRAGQSVAEWGVEELEAVQARTQALIKEISQPYPRILVTHGDVASNIITTYNNEPLSKHREVGGLKTAEFIILK